jgi:hypothetical protein
MQKGESQDVSHTLFYAIDGLALGFLAFQVAGALIHLLLIVAVISLIAHFVRGRSGA